MGRATGACTTVARRLAQATAELRAVGEISAALASAWELETTLDVITRITSEVMAVTSCSIYLQEKGTDRLVLKATTGLAKAAVGRASLGVGEGLTGWAVIHGQPVAARDAISDPRFKPLPETREETLQSLLAVPLTVQGRVIGAMNVQTREPHDFGAGEIRLLVLVANLAAGALEKATLYDSMRRHIEELEALAEVSRTVTSPLYLDEMLGVLAEMAARVMNAKATCLHLLDESSGLLVLRATHNTDAAKREHTSIKLGSGVVGAVAEQCAPLIVANVRVAPQYLNQSLAETEGLVSLLSVPLVVRGRAVGTFSCYMGAHHDFASKEVALFSTLANQTALAIENARLVINSAVVREMHHRVKNNLQTVAMLLRLQLSAARGLQAEDVLGDAIARIQSIAAVHETLSERGLKVVDVREVFERVSHSASQNLLPPGLDLAIKITGGGLLLPSRQATALVLVTNELMQNAIKHAFSGRSRGCISISLQAGAEEHQVSVEDDGVGATDLAPARKGIGLEIVRTLVGADLKGSLDIQKLPVGTKATIRFPAAAE